MWVVKHKKIFFILSGLLVALSLVAISVWGLEFGIDFTGGSILEVSYTTERPGIDEVRGVLETQELGSASVRETGDSGYVVRTRFLEDSERSALVSALALGEQDALTVERFSSVGPTIGAELRSKALVAIIVVVLAIILFIAFAFRRRGDSTDSTSSSRTGSAGSLRTGLTPNLSGGPSSWKYGITAIIALVHDIIIPTGVFAVLGYFAGAQVDVLFVMALLAILGFSVNDTIVVFDRVRENLRLNHEHNKHEPFDETVGKSLSQTYTRSINTSLTTLIVLIALFIAGGATIQNFVLTLIVGVIIGTYSSIFLASPLLVIFNKKKSK